MKQIVNLFWKNTDNIGDAMSGSCLYFEFPIPVKIVDIKEITLGKEELAKSFIILGGGGHIHIPSPDYNNGVIQGLIDISKLSKWAVTWGIGHNIHDATVQVFPESLNNFLLNGIRDIGNPYDHVPCASCMHPLFDAYSNVEPTKELFVYSHRSRPIDGNMMFCEGSKFEDVIAEIASARTIHTNSYHGAYWSLLLNRTVVVPFPRSSKFFKLYPATMVGDSLHFNRPTNFLALCRKVNIDYHKKVLGLIQNYVEAQ